MRVSWKAFSQKFGILSFSGDFHLLVFFRASLRSSRVISHHCCSFRVSYSLLSFSIHRVSEFSYQFYYQFYYYHYYYHYYYYYYYYYHYYHYYYYTTTIIIVIIVIIIITASCLRSSGNCWDASYFGTFKSLLSNCDWICQLV